MKLKRVKPFDIINTIIMLFLMAIMVYPIIYVFSMSVSTPEAVLSGKVRVFPIGFSLNAYKMAFQDSMILKYYRNTIFYSVVTTLGLLIVTMAAAYALSRNHFFLRKSFTTYIAITMFFSGGLIPSFIINRQLGLYNNIWIMILPGMISAWNIIIARVFIKDSVGESLIEAAQIDGYNDLQILIKIIIPLSSPIIAYLALGSIVARWNSYFDALIYLPNKQLHPIQLFLMRLLIQESNELGRASDNSEMIRYMKLVKYAAIMITIAPILCVYPFLQKYFVKGIMVGAIKE